MREERRAGNGSIEPRAFLQRHGFWRGGYLTRAGVLLFTRSPEFVFPAAIVQFTMFLGDDRTADRAPAQIGGSVARQILSAVELMATRVEKRERRIPGVAQP